MFGAVPGDNIANEQYFVGIMCAIDPVSRGSARQVMTSWIYTRVYLEELVKHDNMINNADE